METTVSRRDALDRSDRAESTVDGLPPELLHESDQFSDAHEDWPTTVESSLSQQNEMTEDEDQLGEPSEVEVMETELQPQPIESPATEPAAEPAEVAESAPDTSEASQPVVELPPPLPAPPDEQTVAPEAIELTGPSDAAMVHFVEMTPSQIAATQPVLGATLNNAVREEQRSEAENPPALVLKVSGDSEGGLTAPEQIPLPGDVQIGDGIVGTDPGPLTVEDHVDLGEIPSNALQERQLDQQVDADFLAWLGINMQAFLESIKTKDDGINTSAGPRPHVQLTESADPNKRMAEPRGDAERELVAARDSSVEAFRNHHGQGNIRPREINETPLVEVSNEPSTAIELAADPGAADYVAVSLPADVRMQADALLQPGLQSHLEPVRGQTQLAAEQRDSDKTSEVDKAQTETEQLRRNADLDQRNTVIKNRQAVVELQKEGVHQAYEQVNDFNREADQEQLAARREIDEKVKEAEGGATKALEEGESKAETAKKEGEREAEAKKKQLEEEQKKKSWWDRAVGVVKRAVKAITSFVSKVFARVRKAVSDFIQAAKKMATRLINAARDWVIDKLNRFRDWAKGMVNTFLKDRFPGLAARINRSIDGLVDTAIDAVNVVADTAIAGVNALADRLAAVLDRILQVFETAIKAAVQIVGAVITGDFAEALRVAIQAACDIVGIDSKPIFDFFDRAGSLVMNILKSPKSFFNNLMSAVGGGVRNFGKNIKQHLIKGLVGWLTGALSETDITLPEQFDLKGIFSLVMQILGLTYENIKARLIKRFPPAAGVISSIEKGLAFIGALATRGPAGLWEEVKQSLSNLKDTVFSTIESFVTNKVVTEALTWLLGLLNPAGAIVKIVKLLYDFVMFLIERFQQIKDFVLSVYEAIASIASGVLDKATAAVEEALGRSLPVVISLLATLAGLRDIGKMVKSLIRTVSDPVNKAIDMVIDRAIEFARKLLAKGHAAVGRVREKIADWWRIRKRFKSEDGEAHTLTFQGSGPSAVLTISSTPRSYKSYIASIQTKGKSSAFVSTRAQALQLAEKIDANKRRQSDSGRQVDEMTQWLNELAVLTATLGSEEPKTPPSVIEYGGLRPSGAATSMTANVLSASVTAGSPPKDKPDIWRRVSRRKVSGVSVYVQGHLLNEKLGGPGRAYNLTPITRTANAMHERDAEHELKEKITGPTREVVKYTVKSVYGSHAKSTYQKQLEARKSSLKRAEQERLDLMTYEAKEMPTSLEWRWQLLAYDKETRKWIPDAKAPNHGHSGTVPIDLPQDAFVLS